PPPWSRAPAVVSDSVGSRSQRPPTAFDCLIQPAQWPRTPCDRELLPREVRSYQRARQQRMSLIKAVIPSQRASCQRPHHSTPAGRCAPRAPKPPPHQKVPRGGPSREGVQSKAPAPPPRRHTGGAPSPPCLHNGRGAPPLFRLAPQ